jgi:hypothetical protein
VIASYPIATFGCDGNAAENIAAANDNAYLDAKSTRFSYVAGNAIGYRHIDSEPLIAHERFAGGLEQNAFVDSRTSHGTFLRVVANSGYTKGIALSRDAL